MLLLTLGNKRNHRNPLPQRYPGGPIDMARALTTKAIENLKPDLTKRVELPDPGLTGLYLVVQPSGAKSWAVRYRHAGKPRKMTLGKWPVIGLADARAAASSALEAVEYGRDPGSEKLAAKAERASNAEQDSIESLMKAYGKRKLSNLRSGATVKRELERHAVAAWSGREIQTITKRDVLDLLDSIVDSGRLTTANRLRAYLGTFFNWCVERDVVLSSPMVGIKAPAKEVSRDRVLSDDEIRWFWLACENAGQPWGTLGKLLILTGQRLGEVVGMTDGEIDGGTWHLSAHRTKNGRANDVPLSSLALDVLTSIKRIEGSAGYVNTTTGDTPVSGYFKGRNTIAEHMAQIAAEELREPVEIPHWTFHDLRRTAATGMARLGIPVVDIEAVLNHVSGTKAGVAGIYNRHSYENEKRRALEAWARCIGDLAEGKPNNVVQLETRHA